MNVNNRIEDGDVRIERESWITRDGDLFVAQGGEPITRRRTNPRERLITRSDERVLGKRAIIETIHD